MITYNLLPNTPEWHAHRNSGLCNASEAPAMLNLSPYTSRQELLRRKATGYVAEVDNATQGRFDAGHEAEANARPNAELIVGETLPAAIVSDDDHFLGASLDGMTFDGSIIWENKIFNQTLFDFIDNNDDLPETHWPQVEQQLHITGAEKCLFTLADQDGTIRKGLMYKSRPERISEVLAGWQQFVADLANYVPEPVAEIMPIGKAPELLPALNIQITGMVKASNIAAFTSHAKAVFAEIKTDLATDEDFADAEKTVKWCEDVEDRLTRAKESALSQTADIDAIFKAIDSISAEARDVRLNLTKKVKTRKEQIRMEIFQQAVNELNSYVDKINLDLGFKAGINIISVDSDFNAAMKSKRTIQSLRDAVAGELARSKIEANKQRDLVAANLAILSELTRDHKFLFNDAHALVKKNPDDLRAVCENRIAKYKHDEADRLAREAEAARIKAEHEKKQEDERIAREEAAKAEADRIRLQEIEFEKIAKEKFKDNEPVIQQPAPAPILRDIEPKTMDAMQIVKVIRHTFTVSEETAIAWIIQAGKELSQL